jgi:hypothetical protein
MPIKVICPDCDATIKAPNDAAGTRIDCPECDAEVRVPKAKTEKPRPAGDGDSKPQPRSSNRDEPEDRPAKRRPAARDEDDDRPPKKRSSNRDEDDDRPAKRRTAARDDDDDRPVKRRSSNRDEDDDRPRKSKKMSEKKKAEAKRRLMIRLLIGGGVAVFVLALVGGYIAYRMSQPDADKKIDGQEWYKADHPDGLFTAYFPGDKPKYEKTGFQPSGFLAKKAGQKAEELGFSSEIWTRKEDGREYSISLLTLPGSNTGTEAEQIAARTRTAPGPGVNLVLDDHVQVGNRQARRLVTRKDNKGQASLTMGVGGRQLLSIVVSGDGSVDHNDPKVKAFFDNFTFHK